MTQTTQHPNQEPKHSVVLIPQPTTTTNHTQPNTNTNNGFITIKISRELYTIAKKICEYEKISMNKLFTKALSEYALNHYKRPEPNSNSNLTTPTPNDTTTPNPNHNLFKPQNL